MIITKQKIEEFESWAKEQPKDIRDVALQYPLYLQYRIKQGAPYALSCPGSKCIIISYNPGGLVTVVVKAEDILPATIEHQKFLCKTHGTDIRRVLGRPIANKIEPKYLEPITE